LVERVKILLSLSLRAISPRLADHQWQLISQIAVSVPRNQRTKSSTYCRFVNAMTFWTDPLLTYSDLCNPYRNI
jgi:hypothetical protein